MYNSVVVCYLGRANITGLFYFSANSIILLNFMFIENQQLKEKKKSGISIGGKKCL